MQITEGLKGMSRVSQGRLSKVFIWFQETMETKPRGYVIVFTSPRLTHASGRIEPVSLKVPQSSEKLSRYFDSYDEQTCAIKMSIAISAQLAEDTMDSSKSPLKSHKKHKSAPEKEKKKRKRDSEDGHRSKSKKHKSDKTASKPAPDAVAEEKEKPSPFHIQTSSLHLPLAPISQGAPLEGLCAEHISPLILRYFPPFGGVILSYSAPRISCDAFGNDGSTTLLQSVDEGAAAWCWLTAEFLLFKPDRGAWLEGYMNLQNPGHVGVVCWNLFNANIKRDSLPESWKWVGVEDQVAEGDEKYAEDGQGYFVDADGKKIEGMVRFRVREIESSHDKDTGFLSIEGTMLDDKAEKRLLLSERENHKSSRDTAGRRLGGATAPGATSLAVAVEPDLMDVDSGAKKYKKTY